MKRDDLFDALQQLMPDGLQFVRPYTDRDALPPPRTNWATMNIMNVDTRAWSQRRQVSYDDNTGTVTNAYDVQRVYSVQFDFYGPDAWNNALTFQQTLQVNMTTTDGIVDFKTTSQIRDLTFLQPNTDYEYRFNFDVDVFVIDTITKNAPIIETAEIRIVNRGNNFTTQE